MSSEEPGSITVMLQALRAGDPETARALWDRYRARLIALVRQRLGNAPHRSIEDEEDVALSAFHCLLEGAIAGRFNGFQDRDGLWRLLTGIAGKKVLTQHEFYGRLKRGGAPFPTDGRASSLPPLEQGSEAADGLNDVPHSCPGPFELAAATDLHRRLLDVLDDEQLRRIVTLRAEGLTTPEIATRLGVVDRTVERKLERIRLIWLESGLLDL